MIMKQLAKYWQQFITYLSRDYYRTVLKANEQMISVVASQERIIEERDLEIKMLCAELDAKSMEIVKLNHANKNLNTEISETYDRLQESHSEIFVMNHKINKLYGTIESMRQLARKITYTGEMSND